MTRTGDTTMKPRRAAAIVAVLVAAAAAGCTSEPPPIVVTPTPLHSDTAPMVPGPTPRTPAVTFTDGTYEVLIDIEPGKYKTAGPVSSPVPICYWARLKGTSGQLADIITNGNPTGPTTVTISPGDAAFETQGCQPWTLTAPA